MTPTPTPSRQAAALTKDIDRLGYLLAKEHADKPWRKELADLKAKLQGHCQDFPAGSPVHLQGSLYYLDFTPRELKREITNKPKAFAALRKVMGLSALTQALTYTFKLLDAHVPEAEQSKFVEITQTGSRDVTGGLINTPAA